MLSNQKISVSPDVSGLKGSAIAAVATTFRDLKAEGHEVYNLAMGNPGHAVSEAAKAAMIDHIKTGKSVYGPKYGILPLREAIAEDTNNTYGTDFSAKNAVVTAGSAMATAALQEMVLFEKGDKAMVFTPAYSSYYGVMGLQGAERVCVEMSKHNGFKPNIDAIKKAFAEHAYTTKSGRQGTRIRSLIVNYPNNPTGAVLSESESKELAGCLNEIASQYWGDRGILLLLDDVYKDITFGAENHSIYPYLSPALRENAAILFSASKGTSLPGERIGGAIVNEELAGHLAKAVGARMLSPGMAAQTAFETDLRAKLQGRSEQQDLSKFYGEKSDFIATRLNDIAAKAKWPAHKKPINIAPQGSIFLFADLSGMIGRKVPAGLVEKLGTNTIRNDQDISAYLLNIAALKDSKGTPYAGVAVVPGSGFGVDSEKGFVRMCVSGEFNTPLAQDKVLKNAMNAIEKAAMLQVPELLASKNNTAKATSHSL